MKRGSTQSIVFTPPSSQVRETREADRASVTVEQHLTDDPQEAVLLYGHMLTDVSIVTTELRGLLFSAADYRSSLRVIRGAAKRLEDRAARLLGDIP